MAAMDDALGSVHHREGAVCLGQLQQGLQRLPGAEHVGQLAHRQQARAWANQAGGGVQVDHAVIVQRQDHQRERATFGQLLPGQQVGVVFQGAEAISSPALNKCSRP